MIYVDDSGYPADDPKRNADLTGTRIRCCVECDQLPWNCVCEHGPMFAPRGLSQGAA